MRRNEELFDRLSQVAQFAVAVVLGLAAFVAFINLISGPTQSITAETDAAGKSDEILASGQSYPNPALPTPLPAIATSLPAAITPLAALPGGGLVGAEWLIIASGDTNRNGRPDVVAYKPASVIPGTSFSQGQYVGYIGSAAEVVFVEADGSGRAQVQVFASRAGMDLYGGRQVSFNNAAALMFSVTTGTPVTISVVPIDGAGNPFAQTAAARWDSAAGIWRATDIAGK